MDAREAVRRIELIEREWHDIASAPATVKDEQRDLRAFLRQAPEPKPRPSRETVGASSR